MQILSKKYLRCSARMMVVQLQKLLRMKLNIPGEKQVSFQCTECSLHVSECEMSHLLAWSPESVLNFILVNRQLSQKDIPLTSVT